MVLKKKEELTSSSILRDMRLFEKEKLEDILSDICRNSYHYTFEDFENDMKNVESFLLSGDKKQVLSYLKLVTYMMDSDYEDIFEYLLLFSSAKLFFSYGEMIQNYLPVHQQLLTEAYMYIPMNRMDSSIEVIMDHKFYERELTLGGSYEDLLNSMNLMVETTEYYNEEEIGQKGKILH